MGSLYGKRVLCLPGAQRGPVGWGGESVGTAPLEALNSAPRGPGCFLHLDQETVLLPGM